MQLKQHTDIVSRFIETQQPAGNEPKQLAVRYLNDVCDKLYPDAAPHRYTIQRFGDWRRGTRPIPPPVLVVMQSEILQSELIGIGVSEEYVSQLAAALGLPQF